MGFRECGTKERSELRRKKSIYGRINHRRSEQNSKSKRETPECERKIKKKEKEFDKRNRLCVRGVII